MTSPLPPLAYDLLAALIVLIGILRGYQKGLIREGSSIASLLGASLLAEPIGRTLEPALTAEGIPPLLLSPIGLTLGALLSYLLLRLALSLLSFLFKLHRFTQGRLGMVIHVGGAILGAGFSTVVVLVLSWSLLTIGPLAESVLTPLAMIETSSPQGAKDPLEALLFPLRLIAQQSRGLSGSLLGKLAARTNPLPRNLLRGLPFPLPLGAPSTIPANVETGATLPLAPTPLLPIQPELLELESIKQLFEDPEIRAMAETGDTSRLLQHPKVQQALQNPAVLKALLKGEEEP